MGFGCYNTSSNIITVETGVGIDKNYKQPTGFVAFEANGLLNLKLGFTTTNEVGIHIHNALGQVVYSFTNIAVVDQHIALNIEALQSGVYIVQLIDGDTNPAQKFTVE